MRVYVGNNLTKIILIVYLIGLSAEAVAAREVELYHLTLASNQTSSYNNAPGTIYLSVD